MADTPQLTEKQKKFCEEYLVDFNASNAAIRAGYKHSNARSTGCKLLQYSVIDAYIVHLRAEQRRRNAEMQELVIRELMLVAFSNARNLIEMVGDQTVLNITDEVNSRTLASLHLSESKNGEAWSRQVNLKMHDKVAALKALGKYLGLFDEKPRSPDDYARVQHREPSLNDIIRYEQSAPQDLPPDTEDGVLE